MRGSVCSVVGQWDDGNKDVEEHGLLFCVCVHVTGTQE